jgi:methyl-accepting chemotaxis protein
MTGTSSSSNSQLANRMEFMQLDAKSCERIRQLKSIIDRELPAGLDKFYERLRGTPEVKRFFQNDAHMTRAKGAQVDHWSSISSGSFDDRYVSKVRTIGLTHARIGLEPRWYIGGYAIILDHLIKAAVSEAWPKGLMQRGGKEAAAEAGEALSALVKAVMLDMDFAISVYMEAAEEARLKGEAEMQEKERSLVANSIGAGMAKLAAQDLTYRLTSEMPEAYRKLQSDFNAALEQLEKAVQGVSSSARAIDSGTQEISSAADDLSRRTEQQASSLEETAAALDEITATVRKTAEGAAQAREVVTAAKADAEKSGDVVRQAVEAMGGIEKSSKQISQIIGVIDEIAFQTNLLALNAGVEAARAGDAGRGFAVVASEVRALAQRSAEAAKEIKGLISASTTQVGLGVNLVGETGKSLERIVAQVTEINTSVSDIAASAQEQATGLQQVNTAINQMDQVTQQNAAMAEEATAASRSLTQESNQLGGLIAKFQITNAGVVEPLRREAPRPGPAARPAAAKPHAKAQPHAAGAPNGAAATARKAAATPAQEEWQDF